MDVKVKYIVEKQLADSTVEHGWERIIETHDEDHANRLLTRATEVYQDVNYTFRLRHVVEVSHVLQTIYRGA